MTYNVKKIKDKNQAGFTIIELMVATMVFATVLVILTSGVIYFTNTYYKGITLSTTQNTARQITEDVSRAIQFGGNASTAQKALIGSSPDEAYYLCVGGKRYTYVLDKQVSDNPSNGQAYHALVVDKPSVCNAPNEKFNSNDVAGSSVATTQELIPSRMRLVEFSVVPVSSGGADNLYKITVSVAFGDDDLFEVKSDGKPDYRRCATTKGSHFCGTATLVTSVQERV